MNQLKAMVIGSLMALAAATASAQQGEAKASSQGSAAAPALESTGPIDLIDLQNRNIVVGSNSYFIAPDVEVRAADGGYVTLEDLEPGDRVAVGHERGSRLAKEILLVSDQGSGGAQ